MDKGVNYSVLIKYIKQDDFKFNFKEIDLEEFTYSKIDIGAQIRCINQINHDEFLYSLKLNLDYENEPGEFVELLSIEVDFLFELQVADSNQSNKVSDYYITAKSQKYFLSNFNNEELNNNEDDLPKEISRIFFSIAYGCIRGMLVMHNYNMPIPFILPVIDFDKVLEKGEPIKN